MADSAQHLEEFFIRLRSDVTPAAWKLALERRSMGVCACQQWTIRLVDGLKFSAALPRRLAEATLAQRLSDIMGARKALEEPHRFLTM